MCLRFKTYRFLSKTQTILSVNVQVCIYNPSVNSEFYFFKFSRLCSEVSLPLGLVLQRVDGTLDVLGMSTGLDRCLATVLLKNLNSSNLGNQTNGMATVFCMHRTIIISVSTISMLSVIL